MPKPSSNPDKARQGGGGVEAGVYEVIGAKYQNIKTDYKACQPCLVFDAAVCDKDGDRVKGADPVEIPFGFGSKALEAFHPGTAKSATDNDPKDEGESVDAEGNTIYCADDTQFNKSCAALVFSETLTKAGFPKDVLDQTYAPNFIGLKFELDTLDAKSINEKFGTRLNTKPLPDGGTVTYKVCKKWLNPNYLSGAAAGGTKNGAGKDGKGDAADNSGGGKPDYDSMTDEQLAEHCLAAVSEARSGEKGTVKTLAQLAGLVTNQYTAKAKMPASRLKAVVAVVKNAAWAQEACENLGATWGEEPAQIVFP